MTPLRDVTRTDCHDRMSRGDAAGRADAHPPDRPHLVPVDDAVAAPRSDVPI
jgi:hypothetical protein